MVTLSDIAKEAGVSTSSVSLVLRGKDKTVGISESTRKKILEAAERLHYVPNQIAVSLVTKQTRTIGLIYSDILNPFYAELALGVERHARANGYGLLICNCDGQVGQCIENISLLESRLIDGFILQPPEAVNISEEPLHLLQNKLENISTPYVILDRAIHDVWHDYVAADHTMGGRLATEHLIQLGHRRIGCITGSQSDYGTKKRLLGYRETLETHGIAYDESLVYEGLYQVETGYRGAMALFRKEVTAIFAFSDLIAVGVQRAAGERGLEIPEKMSLVGYDDSFLANLCAVPLTTIRQPTEFLGRRACEVLLDRMKDPDRENRDYYYPPALIQRSSCAMPPCQ